MEDNSINAVFIGSSYVHTGVNPLLLWHDYGITSYDMVSSTQRIWISEYYIREVLKRQSPDLIALEVGIVFTDAPNDEDRNRKALDYMRMSIEKIAAIRASIAGAPNETFLSYLFPILRYHKRWAELNELDFKYFSSDRHFPLNGFDPAYAVNPHSTEQWRTNQKEGIVIPERNKKYLREIVSLCDENNISLFLFKTPSTIWSLDEHEQIKEFAKEYDLPFMDYNLLTKEIKLEDNDFTDATHMNINGANKMTAHLGRYLIDNYSWQDKGDDMIWEKDYGFWLNYDSDMRKSNDLS